MPAAQAHGSPAILSLLSRYEGRCKDVWLLPSSANKIAYGDAACVLGIRPYATLASLDDLGYGMLFIAKH